MPFIDYSKQNPFGLFDASDIELIAEALRNYQKNVDINPHSLVLVEYAEEEYDRESEKDASEAREAVLDEKMARIEGWPGPANGATNADEYWAQYPDRYRCLVLASSDHRGQGQGVKKMNIDIIKKQPKVLSDMQLLNTACYVASILGENNSVMGDNEPLEVLWDCQAHPYGAWLTQHGLYISDDLDTAHLYTLVGYCAYQGVPFFTDDKVLQLQEPAVS